MYCTDHQLFSISFLLIFFSLLFSRPNNCSADIIIIFIPEYSIIYSEENSTKWMYHDVLQILGKVSERVSAGRVLLACLLLGVVGDLLYASAALHVSSLDLNGGVLRGDPCFPHGATSSSLNASHSLNSSVATYCDTPSPSWWVGPVARVVMARVLVGLAAGQHAVLQAFILSFNGPQDGSNGQRMNQLVLTSSIAFVVGPGTSISTSFLFCVLNDLQLWQRPHQDWS